MRVLSLLTALLLSISSATAQVQWIANASFANGSSLYDLIEDGRPVILAIGNRHTQSSEQLLNSGILQQLTTEHDAGSSAAPFSTKDLRVAFVDVQVFPEDAEAYFDDHVQFYQLNERDEALDRSGWNRLYSISRTGVFLVTPDRLVRPLKGMTAEDIYAETKFWNTKVRPTSKPDIRLLDATVSREGKAEVRVQNFSISPVHGLHVLAMKNGKVVAEAYSEVLISPLEDAVITLNMPECGTSDFTLIAKIDGDGNELNNYWTGKLRNSGTVVASAFLK